MEWKTIFVIYFLCQILFLILLLNFFSEKQSEEHPDKTIDPSKKLPNIDVYSTGEEIIQTD